MRAFGGPTHGGGRRRRHRLISTVALAVVLTLVASGCSAQALFDAACAGTLVSGSNGSVDSAALTEISGIAASLDNDDVLWAHNDSGHPARLYAMTRSGDHLGYYSLTGAGATDWEDLGLGPGPTAGETYLYAADIGDNAAVRASVQIYRAGEPTVDTVTPPGDGVALAADRLTLTYPDRAHNAEAFFVDPITGELWIITKEGSGVAQFFRAPANLAAGSTTVLSSEGSLALGAGTLVTGADIARAGDLIGIRTYSQVRLYWRETGQPIATALAGTACMGAATPEAQGEAFAFDRSSHGYYTISEGLHPAVNYHSL
jgi:hypothetical protein